MITTTKYQYSTGFTLIELLITLAIAAISLFIAVPSLQQNLNSNRLTTQANSLISSFYSTRSEAIKRNTRVTMRKSGTDWKNGWIIFTDGNNNALFDAALGEKLLNQSSALTGGNTLHGNRFVRDYISYTGDGGSRSKTGAFQAGTLMLCDHTGLSDPKHARAIIIGSSGRPRTSTQVRDLKRCG
ncbi:MAG: general secretion pathway protein GspH [Thiothrix sp.]|nr:MAG: general secretion pathway protein GspH [Thiothrix sp.]